ncbi:hypothetical protein [Mucilaginibacter xinganensis]|uniref:Uncharacterized protein n=1 Tax=Mucilaginibacter xinganensis TaxID=1234841 RepID=A0A223NU34_9SPHI|nr:hypothetical protein [Mucilaginibacter xinganensis]ASU33148.1 hypothetical protein MuYL_1250 [Mucilaginibacter xinganensis]
MIQKTLKTTTGKLKVQIPDKLDEITLGQLIALQQSPDLNDLEAISILSAIPVKELQNVQSPADFALLGGGMLSLSHQIEHLYNSDAIPKRVTFTTGKTVNITGNLAVEPVGAFMAAREIISDEISVHVARYGDEGWQQTFKPSLNACCQVLAHYFYCKATGKPYNEYEAEEFTSEIKQLRVTEALPIAKHFFTYYPGSSRMKTGSFRRLLQHLSAALVSKRSKSLNTSTL